MVFTGLFIDPVITIQFTVYNTDYNTVTLSLLVLSHP